MTPLQHLVAHMEAQAMAMTTVHTTLRGMILIHHLVRRMKGEVTSMTTDHIIELLISFPPHSALPINNQPTTLTITHIIISRTILLWLFTHMWSHAIGKRKSTSDSLKKQLDKAKLIIRESLKMIIASIMHSGMRFITSTPGQAFGPSRPSCWFDEMDSNSDYKWLMVVIARAIQSM